MVLSGEIFENWFNFFTRGTSVAVKINDYSFVFFNQVYELVFIHNFYNQFSIGVVFNLVSVLNEHLVPLRILIELILKVVDKWSESLAKLCVQNFVGQVENVFRNAGTY